MIDRDALVSEVLPQALRHAKRMARGNRALREHLEDMATKAIVTALNKYDPATVASWPAYAMSFLSRVRFVNGHRRVVGTLPTAAARFIKKQERMPVAMPMGCEDDEAESNLGSHRTQMHSASIDPPHHGRPMDGEVPLSIESRQLPPELFEPFKLVFVDGHTMEEAAVILGIDRDTVRERHRQAAEIIAGVVKPVDPVAKLCQQLTDIAVQIGAVLDKMCSGDAEYLGRAQPSRRRQSSPPRISALPIAV